MIDQMTKASTFQALHKQTKPLLLPNPWDKGTALLLESLGFQALATTSLGLANMLGVKRASKQAILDNCRSICEVTDLPVSVDLENGFADEPKEVAEVIQQAYEYGAVEPQLKTGRGMKTRQSTTLTWRLSVFTRLLKWLGLYPFLLC